MASGVASPKLQGHATTSTVTNAKIIDNEIKLDIDLEILAEVIGETKMQVTVFTPIVNEDDDIDDLDIEVNEDFLNDK